MALIIRIITDLLWQLKEVAILSNLGILLLVVVTARTFKLKDHQLRITLIATFLMTSFLLSFLMDVNTETTKLFVKIFGSILMFYIGITDKLMIKYLPIITKVNIVLMLLFFVMAIVGIGYQSWGSALTFSGPYFFKTDLSLSVLIAYTFILISPTILPKYKIILACVCLYLVIIANARIHYLTFFLVTLVYLFRYRFFKIKLHHLLMFVPLVAMIFIGFVSVIYNYLPKDFLVLDLTNEGIASTRNLQGRDVIWESLIKSFFSHGIGYQFFGLGLSADQTITAASLGADHEYNAHNSFVYILISIGWIGSFIFLIFIYNIFRQYTHIKRLFFFNKRYQVILFMFITHFLIFVIISFSNAAILYQQQTWFFMYFSGALFQNFKKEVKGTVTSLRL